jgi:hypothetical protein
MYEMLKFLDKVDGGGTNYGKRVRFR